MDAHAPGGEQVVVRSGLLSVAGPGAGCNRDVTRLEVAFLLGREVDRWLRAGPAAGDLDGVVLAQHVLQEVRWAGVASLDARLISDLAAVRDRHRGPDPLLDAFLDCVLAKHDGRYWNRTYLCLPVLELLTEGPDAPLDPIAMSALLAADVVRHELCASARGMPVSPLDRPGPRVLQTRVRHAMRFMAANLGAPAAVEVVGELAHSPEAGLPDLLRTLPAAPAPWAAMWLAVTALPVSTIHDETFFLRALQAHEMGYAACSRRIGGATAALRDGQPAAAAGLVDGARILVERGASLFRMVATMRSEAFHTFRDCTDGASAIQSEQYKRFEARCATPAGIRLRSPAFADIPVVRAEASSGQDTLVDAYRDARSRWPGDPRLDVLVDRMGALDSSHRRWKAAHLSLASRMLGPVRGSGYTAGVPYLQAWVDRRLFAALPEVVAAGDAGSRRRRDTPRAPRQLPVDRPVPAPAE